jgi:hypothetical protein
VANASAATALNVDQCIHIIIGLDPEDFSRVHNVGGVDRLLDRMHDAHSIAVLGNQKSILPQQMPCSPVQVPSSDSGSLHNSSS